MKHIEDTKKLPEEAVPEQAQMAPKAEEEERAFWLDTKYSDASCDSDR